MGGRISTSGRRAVPAEWPGPPRRPSRCAGSAGRASSPRSRQAVRRASSAVSRPAFRTDQQLDRAVAGREWRRAHASRTDRAGCGARRATTVPGSSTAAAVRVSAAACCARTARTRSTTIERQCSSLRSACAPSSRTTLRVVSTGAIACTPSSVAFWIVQSMRSVRDTACTSVISQRRLHDARLCLEHAHPHARAHARHDLGREVGTPAVEQHERIADTEPQHLEHVMGCGVGEFRLETRLERHTAVDARHVARGGPDSVARRGDERIDLARARSRTAA